MSFAIGSFNLHKWSDDSDRSFYFLSNIINQEGFDVVALQEVFGGNWLKDLCTRHLANKWDYCFDIPNNSSKNEGYAFIWKKNVFKLSEKIGGEENPRIYESYKIPEINGVNIKRPPYYVRLTPIMLPRMEIRLINTHMMSSSSGNVALRQSEYSTIMRSIVQSVLQAEANKPINNKDFYTFLLGDYNLTLAQLNRLDLNIEYRNFSTPVSNKQNEPSTLSNNEQNIRQIYTENDFDHFSFGEGTLHGASVICERIDAVTKYYGLDGREEYKAKISDHVPVKLTLDIK